MNDKKLQIMEAAVKSFADKGYHATSIHVIAESIGMAKGSLYFYFSSKEDLLVSICHHYVGLMVEKQRSFAQDPKLSARERLVKQVILHFQQLEEHRDFLVVLMRERVEVNDEMHRMLLSFQGKVIMDCQQNIIEAYGEAVRPYSFDGAVMFNAVLSGYLGMVVLYQNRLDPEQISLFMLDRLDDMMKSMKEGGATPLLTAVELEKFCNLDMFGDKKRNSNVFLEIEAARLLIENHEIQDDQIEEIRSSLHLIEKEFAKEQPHKVLIKGMLALLKTIKINELKKHIVKIESYL
ncbi:TetR/AcrR family transcriptional regulator [Paenibacillus eucommiae]|uniref:AcrR family transcriptional regulator n=1 Tax=Paenibacillus eucommiae TaxID=1355755 RepID=A0ABS4J7V3_9BACL|nr:TetR/AcrR family transcriptional regulator [Paenibacillus eucommiae]MBP1995913.1 AcrR family transcriptional regulator [Paenibacillus eucommiae]